LPKHAKLSSHGVAHWQSARAPRRSWVRRLVAYALVIGALIYLFNLSFSSDPHAASTASRTGRYDDDIERAYTERLQNARPKEPLHPHQPPPPPSPANTDTSDQQKEGTEPKQASHDQGKKQDAVGSDAGHAKPRPKYDGPIRYPALASSLRAITATGGASPLNRNVLFAAASLQSASTLLPMACQMATERESYVHFAFMGMSDIEMLALLEVNGIDKTCPLILHGMPARHRAIEKTIDF
jgi:hypothetical protein